MKPTHTGIAAALALAVVASFYLFPGLLPLPMPGTEAAPLDESPQLQATSTQQNLPMSTTNLQITDELVGTGAAAAPGDTVTVNYVGALTDGSVFDASADHGDTGFTFALGVGQVIRGWDEGLVGMKEGGKRRLVIPPGLAYGERAIGNVIPANSTLVFEVELVKVEKRELPR
ncbi:FKBP-type peptidyl-prolyl cis-trans isomerase [Candidatus Kaiserbacteria bacterium]|nr:FKBP-type peptidyl-prolyl cis-trans isomerase [Candidatus Kaiserbacteria bacterium]